MDNLSIINEFVKLARIAELLENERPDVAKMIDETIKQAATELEKKYPPIETPVIDEYKYVPSSETDKLDQIADDIYSSKEFQEIKHNLNTKEASNKLDQLIYRKLA
jgi:hypothetical protein